MDKIRDEINSPSPDPAVEIQEGIRRTEARMSATINEIEERLSPANIKARAKEKVRRYSLIGLVKVNDAVRSKPVPAALVGVGVAWLLVRKMTHRRGARRQPAAMHEVRPAKPQKQPAESMKTYFNMAKIAVAVVSAISTYLIREKEAGRSPFKRTGTHPEAAPQSWAYPPSREVPRGRETLAR